MKEIVLYPNLILNRPCGIVEDIQIAKDILTEMEEATISYDAHGIAANQLGYNIRAIFVNTETITRKMINPSIVNHSKDSISENEGCLSFPGIEVQIPRYSSITVNYLDETGQEVEEEFMDFDARVVQHEIDHINGIHILKHASRASTHEILRRLKNNKRKLKRYKK